MNQHELDEKIKIEPCPECQKTHTYNLVVTRSILMIYMSESDFGEKPREVKLTRTFTCPNTQKDFEAPFILKDTTTDRIEDVRVSGIAD